MFSPIRHSGSVLWKRRPIHLTFFVTRRCNSRCPFCFYLKSTDHPPENSPELTLDEIERISRSFGSLLWLAFSGGEIFLRRDLAEISRTFYRNNRPSVMLFPTNGLLPQIIRDTVLEILEACSESVITVKLSLDGIGEEHDRVRNTPGSFEKTIETYRLLGGLLEGHPNFELGINTVFCSENQDHMDSIIDYVQGMGQINTHTISLVRGNLLQEGYKNVDIGKYRHAISRLEANLKAGGAKTYRFRGGRIKAAQDILQRDLIRRTMEEQRRMIPCYAGRLNLVLTEDGEVYPCEILRDSLGNIRDFDYDIGRLMKGEKAKRIITRIADCGCYCTHECYYMTNILFNPSLYPRLVKEYLQVPRRS